MKGINALLGIVTVLGMSIWARPAVANTQTVEYTIYSYGSVAYTLNGQHDQFAKGQIIEDASLPVGTKLCVTSSVGTLILRDKNGNELVADKTQPCVTTKAVEDPSLMQMVWRQFLPHLSASKGEGEENIAGVSRGGLADVGFYLTAQGNLILVTDSWFTTPSLLPFTLKLFDDQGTRTFTQQSRLQDFTRFVIPAQAFTDLKQMKILITTRSGKALIDEELVKSASGQWVIPKTEITE